MAGKWKAVVKARVKGGMCPVCAERAVLQGYNDLGTTDPHLLSEWDYEKNSKWTPSNVSRNSMKVVWWKCGAGHSYRAKITDRTIEQKGCPQVSTGSPADADNDVWSAERHYGQKQ